MKYLLHLLLFLPLLAAAQSGDMRVYTVAGWTTIRTETSDGTPATNAKISATEGVWMDNKCNIYFTDNGSKIKKVDMATGLIYTVAGNGIGGITGDGGPATNARISSYGIFVNNNNDIYFADAYNSIRRVDANTNIITTVAGGGGSVGDGGLATAAMLVYPQNVYGDRAGNLYIGEKGRIRKVNTAGIITTIAGTGAWGLSGDGGAATAAQVYVPTTMLMDADGNLLFADRGNSRIRKINKATGIITTVAGSTAGYSGDGGLATNAQLTGPLSFAIDKFNNLIIGDNVNNYIRFVDAATGIISTIGGVGATVHGDLTEGALASVADIHPEFLYLDLKGNLYFSNFGSQIRKITNYNPTLPNGNNNCSATDLPMLYTKSSTDFSVYPNPCVSEFSIKISSNEYERFSLINNVGQFALNNISLQPGENRINVNELPKGHYILILKGQKTITSRKIIVN